MARTAPTSVAPLDARYLHNGFQGTERVGTAVVRAVRGKWQVQRRLEPAGSIRVSNSMHLRCHEPSRVGSLFLSALPLRFPVCPPRRQSIIRIYVGKLTDVRLFVWSLPTERVRKGECERRT